MAYMDKEKKAKIAAALKLVVPKSWKYSLAVNNHSTIVMNIKSAPVDLVAEMRENWIKNLPDESLNRGFSDVYYAQVNSYHFTKQFDRSLDLFSKIMHCLNIDNFDKSDIQSDYFHVGHYVDINVGRYDKPFVVQ